MNTRALLAVALLCLTLWTCVREVTRAWAAVELAQAGLVQAKPTTPTKTR